MLKFLISFTFIFFLNSLQANENLGLVEAEMFLFEGEQYFNFLAQIKGEGTIIGEKNINDLTEKQEIMDMFYTGRHKADQYAWRCMSTENGTCKNIEIIWKDPQSSEDKLSCRLGLSYLDGLYFLTQDYSCTPFTLLSIVNSNG